MTEQGSDPAPLTEALAAFVGAFRPAVLPDEVKESTLNVVRDGTGAMLTAANPAYSTGPLIAEFVRRHGGKAEATVVGHGFKTDCVNAALANGTLGYACDIEPYHPGAILHPIAVLIPTALAVGERTGASGEAFLAAVALGCEVEYRVSMAIGPAQQYALGFHPSAVCGTFGAAAAAGFLLGLEAQAMVRAFGLSACQASGMMAWENDPTENARPFQMGMAARNGITAALLAEAGFGGPVSVFDHGHTVFHAFSRDARPELLTADLGKTWNGITELAIKPFSCVAFLHPGVDALLDIVDEEDLAPGDIESLAMHFPSSGVHCIDDNPLRSHSAQYILPVAVADREVRVGVFFEDRRETDPALAELSRRTRVVADEGELEDAFPDSYATIIEVTTRDGRTLRRRNDIARGYPATPLSTQDLEAKFTSLVSAVAPPEGVGALLNAIAGLPEAPSLAEYADLVGRPAQA
ncbi:MAG: MmgE/PrpD family protein [Rhodospirillales bacterium]|jgi:2-methylcitrate dehydratase PrpD|nr:MmgE/PrpD family protein [Rhodospirillales bacterium]MDP6882605.1 MmgE/PrpD family protein [Rhodospirillales bacterium]